MKLLLLMSCSSTHSQKILKGLDQSGTDYEIFTLDPEKSNFVKNVHYCFGIKWVTNLLGKLGYLLYFPYFFWILKKTNPDAIHSFYASSYGLFGALSFNKKHFLSVWGDDIFVFPKKSFIHHSVMKFIINNSHKVLVTSTVLYKEVLRYTSKEPFIIPYGVDLNRFIPAEKSKSNEGVIVLGTVKALEHEYGIDLLIDVFSSVLKLNPDKKLILKIYGDGSQKESLIKQASTLKIEDRVFFQGKISQNEVPGALQDFNIFVALSRRESFGVALVEANACGIPVVAMNVGGISDIIEHGNNGYLANSTQEAVKYLNDLILAENKRVQFGSNGQIMMKRKFDWNQNFTDWLKLHL